ncbi:MAG: CDC48 family AAA ATPase [Deltaproteobacteria bacterium]|nr:CDC48 family AAA ATPase [Deltaproteobacteria bacterium]MBI2499979.1 CDC48 family AAA ATPase [Deltaproteobacteria bacterium]
MGNGLKLKVAESIQRDVGKGIVRLSEESVKRLGLQKGDIVSVKGKRVTAAIPVPSYPQDEGLDIVRMDGLVRANAKVGIGEFVEVSKENWKEARKVTLAPARKDLRLAGSGEGLKPNLLYHPVVEGDLISTTIFQKGRQSFPQDLFSDDLFRGFFESPAFGLMEIRLIVTETVPKGIVRITESTEIELVSEFTESRGGRASEVTYEDLGGMKPILQRVREMIELPLKHPEIFDRLGIDPPKGVLLHGPPGTGKTLLAKAVANESDAHFNVINGPEIMGKFYGESEERLRQVFEQAEAKAPAIIFIDELDSIAPKRAEVTGETERRIVAQLLTLMDGLKARRNVIVIGATNRVDAIDEALRRPGRFDREIMIPIPDGTGRLEILQIHTRGMPLDKKISIEDLASKTYGFTGSDIAALCREAALATLRRFLPTVNLEEKTIPIEILEKLTVTPNDFFQALNEVKPSALREVMVEIPQVRWEDIGGLEEVKRALTEMVELPLKEEESFTRLGIRPPKGILLYGPPGTGKTMIAKAVAHESKANFLTAKGSDLLSKWYGESEKKISEFFQRARTVAPAILFFDELDSLAPARGGNFGDPQVTERVVNQILAEMDGLEELRGVAVIGASNRPDRIDPALLRPGRFDEIVYVAIPDVKAREQIFQSHTKKMQLDKDVDLKKLAEITDKYTGADIAAVCMKAGLYALRESLKTKQIAMEHFYRAVKDTIPSVTESMLREYEKIAKKVKQESVRIGF